MLLSLSHSVIGLKDSVVYCVSATIAFESAVVAQTPVDPTKGRAGSCTGRANAAE